LKLISDLDSQAGKTAYQTYVVQHGIERISVLIPLKNTQAFEERINAGDLPTRQSVLEVVKANNGQHLDERG